MNKVFSAADILIPKNCDFTKWSVIACDQYTSQPEYWENIEAEVGDDPSTLRMVLPEIFLEEPDVSDRIQKINATMNQYIDEGLFTMLPETYILVERTFSDGKSRFGLMGKVDLEEYDYNSGAVSKIRATEGTVLTRLPPRVAVRKDAPIEIPHILLLTDDSEKIVIEPLVIEKEQMKVAYDFKLSGNGGTIKGYILPEEKKTAVDKVLAKMETAEFLKEKYGDSPQSQLLFASGDGNHSLATAKQCWENTKASLSSEEAKNHPARFALVELVNIHEETLEFKAIHRVVFGIEPDKLLADLAQAGEGKEVSHTIKYVCADGEGEVVVRGDKGSLAVGVLQDFLDEYVAEYDAKIDYLHGEDITVELGSEQGNIGFLLDEMDKNELFPAVIARGALPRKTFSMGEADEKRYYLECRKIK